MIPKCFALFVAVWLLGVGPALAQPIVPPASEYRPPSDVRFRVATVISEGVRLHAELFRPADSSDDRKLPAVIMAHGWGGVAGYLRWDAVDLARAGYFVICFDYRGWGESDPRVVLTAPAPSGSDNGTFTAEVRAVRGYIDPFEQVDDWFNVIDWAMGEPMVDTNRIGLRGSSYSGGHVVYVAARDPRVRSIVSQVGSVQDRPETPPASTLAEAARARATRVARGEEGYPPPWQKAIGNLTGAPVGDKLLRWWPNQESAHLTAAALFIVAENEELFRNDDNAGRAFERAAGVKKYVVLPRIQHYGIYYEARDEAIRLAIDWFDQTLKGK